MKPMPSVPRALRTLLTLSLAVSVATACAETSSTTPATDSGSAATDAGSTATDAGSAGSDAGSTGTDAGSTGTDTGGGGGGSQATPMTVKEVLAMAHAAQPKVKTCPQFVNPPAGKKIAVKGLIAVTPTYSAAKTLDGLFSQSKGGGAHNGLRLVGDKASKILANIKAGEGFDIEGQLVIFYCEVQVQVTKITKSADAAVMPQATTVTFADVGETATPEKNNSFEASFITLNDVVVGEKEALGTDGKPHGEFWLGTATGDKGLMVKTDLKFKTTFYTYDKDTKTWATKLEDGQKLKSITGILTYSFSHWKLVPLSDDMLVWESK